LSYEEVMERVRSAAGAAGRRPDAVSVVAVSKTMSAEDIIAVYDMGHRDFGENRAQELAEKAPIRTNAGTRSVIGATRTTVSANTETNAATFGRRIQASIRR
jgi:uncharacterized pyridoxal phosphate-containing UPF0001 family protein